MEDQLNLSMFRAYDIRTPSSLLTPELAERLARAEAFYIREVLGAPGVVVAHDARRTGPQYLTVTIDAFRAAGLDVVYLPGASSTSYFYYAAMRHPQFAAVIVGASHNPSGDTGQKILGQGVRPIAQGIGPEGGLDRIKALYVAGTSASGAKRGDLRAKDLMEDFVNHSMALAGVSPGSLQGASILQDYLFGASGREMMLAFDRAGAALEPLHYAADGTFPLGDPNPVKQSVIRSGLEALRSGRYQLGMFFDGDGDRLDIYRGDGTYLSSSFVYAAILPEIRRRFGGAGPGRVCRSQVESPGDHRDGPNRRDGGRHPQWPFSDQGEFAQRLQQVRRGRGIGSLLRGILARRRGEILHGEHALHCPSCRPDLA